MSNLQALLSDKLRLQMELERRKDSEQSRTDVMIDLATVENEIADLEWEMGKDRIHDHIVRCSGCWQEKILKDCQCKVAGGVTITRCGFCRQEDAYNETERQRNASY